MRGTWEVSAYEIVSVMIPAPCHSCSLASFQVNVLLGWGRVDTPGRVTWFALEDHLEKSSSPSGPTLVDLKKPGRKQSRSRGDSCDHSRTSVLTAGPWGCFPFLASVSSHRSKAGQS